MKTCVIANRKGGTGKSTVAYNLGFSYALKGHRVCFMDLDSQGNLTMLCNAEPCTLEAFKAGERIAVNKFIDLLPATKRFQMLENEVNQLIDRNSYLKKEIIPKLDGYDFLIIDTPPALSILNINAFCAADFVHIILNPDAFSLSGLLEMRSILEEVKSINPELKSRLILNAMFTGRKLTEAALEQLRADPEFLGIEIPHRQHFSNSNALKKPAIDEPEIKALFDRLAEAV